MANEDFVGHHDGAQVPGDAVVVGPQAEEVDQRVEELAVIGVGGRDLSETVGGRMARSGLRAFGADPGTGPR